MVDKGLGNGAAEGSAVAGGVAPVVDTVVVGDAVDIACRAGVPRAGSLRVAAGVGLAAGLGVVTGVGALVSVGLGTVVVTTGLSRATGPCEPGGAGRTVAPGSRQSLADWAATAAGTSASAMAPALVERLAIPCILDPVIAKWGRALVPSTEWPVNPASPKADLCNRGDEGMARNMSDTPQPLHLGQQSALPPSPEAAVLDYVPNPRKGSLFLVRFAAPEFTSLCPVTGQPDFAHLVIDYAPGETIVESKSLKLFLGSFRNHAGFHEDVTVGIGQRLFTEMKPKWLRIGGYWYPRGGIPIDVFWQSGTPPEGLWVPDQGVAGYRGRG